MTLFWPRPFRALLGFNSPPFLLSPLEIADAISRTQVPEILRISRGKKAWGLIEGGEEVNITEVRVSLREGADKKLKAYATLTFDDCFVVRNVKVIDGTKGLFVAMPSRRVRESCQKCSHRNVIHSKFCNNCGAALETALRPLAPDETAYRSEHKDIAHPITPTCREYIQKAVLEAYEKEKASGPSAHKAQGEEV